MVVVVVAFGGGDAVGARGLFSGRVFPLGEAGEVFGVHFLVEGDADLEEDVDGEIGADDRVVAVVRVELEEVE